MLKESLGFALDSIGHRKTRALLTVLGIIIGIAAIVALVLLGNGLENAISEEFSKMGTDIIRVSPKGLRGPPTGSQGLSTDDVDVVENVRGVEYASPMLGVSGDIEYGRQKIFKQIFCYESNLFKDTFEDMGLEVGEGRLVNSGETGVVIIGDGFARGLFDKDVSIRESILVEDEKFKVIGILKDSEIWGDNIAMVMEDCRRVFDKDDDSVSAIAVKVMEGSDPIFVADVIYDKLERARDDENFEVYTSEQLLGQLSSILGIVSGILGAIAAISLIVGGMGIMNSMYTNVLERTREIGVMKAVGAKNGQIMLMFLVESGFYGFVGGVVGVILGVGISKLVEVIAVQGFGFGLLKIKIDFMVVLGALLFSFIIGCISGLFPSRRAAKMRPVDALRYE